MTTRTDKRHASSPAPGRGLILILISVSAINPTAINMFVPALPSIVSALGTDLATGQFILSAYLFATAIAQLVLGSLSDRFGRRPVMIVGLAVFVAAGVLCALAPSIGVLIFARILQGAGGCAGIVLARAIVRDRYDRDRAASMFGYVTMGLAVAPMVSPAIGGAIDDLLGWRSIFALLAALGMVLVIVVLLALPETRREAANEAERLGIARGAMILARIPAFWAYALTCSFATAVFFSFLGAGPFIATEILGMTPTEFGFYFMPVAGGFIIGNFLTARLAQRLGIIPMIITGNAILVLAIAGMIGAFLAAWVHPLALFAPMSGVGLANGLSIANSLAGAVSVRPDLAGAASGLAGSLQIGFGAVATVIIGALLSTGSVFPVAACMMLFAILAVLAALWARALRGP